MEVIAGYPTGANGTAERVTVSQQQGAKNPQAAADGAKSSFELSLAVPAKAQGISTATSMNSIATSQLSTEMLDKLFSLVSQVADILMDKSSSVNDSPDMSNQTAVDLNDKIDILTKNVEKANVEMANFSVQLERLLESTNSDKDANINHNPQVTANLKNSPISPQIENIQKEANHIYFKNSAWADIGSLIMKREKTI